MLLAVQLFYPGLFVFSTLLLMFDSPVFYPIFTFALCNLSEQTHAVNE